MKVIIMLLFVIFFDLVRAQTDACESTYWSQDRCKAAFFQNNLPCYWNEYENTCETIVCSDYSNYYECNNWSNKYGCQWFELQNSAYGQVELCHSECLQYLDIVFTIDVSSSVMSQGDNRQHTLDYVITVMTLWWGIQSEIITKQFELPSSSNTELQNIDEKTAEYTRFGIIYFASQSIVFLDLQYGVTLTEYIERVNLLFNGNYFNYLPFNADDTNIVSALHETYIVFKNGESYYFNKNGLSTKRLAILITDGEPTIPEFSASPCADDYAFAELYHNGIDGESIEFFAALITSDDSSLSNADIFQCFEDYGGTIEPILGYYDLQNAIPGIKLPSNVCQGETSPPTNIPTKIPTASPSDRPTNEPSDKPTHKPTNKPTDKPTDDPTDDPTDLPTCDPSMQPSDLPTDLPSKLPTTSPTDTIYYTPTTKPTTKPSRWWTETQWNKDPTSRPTPKPTKWTKKTPNPTSKPTIKPTEIPNSKPSWWKETRSGSGN